MLGDLVKGRLRLVDQICHARADLMSIGNPLMGGPGTRLSTTSAALAIGPPRPPSRTTHQPLSPSVVGQGVQKWRGGRLPLDSSREAQHRLWRLVCLKSLADVVRTDPMMVVAGPSSKYFLSFSPRPFCVDLIRAVTTWTVICP